MDRWEEEFLSVSERWIGSQKEPGKWLGHSSKNSCLGEGVAGRGAQAGAAHTALERDIEVSWASEGHWVGGRWSGRAFQAEGLADPTAHPALKCGQCCEICKCSPLAGMEPGGQMGVLEGFVLTGVQCSLG